MTSSYVGHDSMTSIVVITSSGCDMEQTVHGGCSQHVGVAIEQHVIGGGFVQHSSSQCLHGLHFLHGFSTITSQIHDEQSEHSDSVNQPKSENISFDSGFLFFF